MPADQNDLDLLTDLLARAQAAGADAADAVMVHATSLSHARRLGELERLERAESSDLGLRVLVGRQQAVVSSTDVTPGALAQLAEQAVAMARSVPEDPNCGLADPEEIAREIPELETCDPEEPAPEVLIERAKACEDAARAVPGITNSEGAEAGWSMSRVTLAASNGFTGGYAGSSHSIGVAVLAGEGQGMERDYDYSSVVYGADLEDPAEVGRRAGERTVRRLNPRKPDTGKYPVVFDPRVGNGLLRHFSGAINGTAIARGTSFLKDAMETEVFATGITIVDDPHRPRGLRSKPFDGEGLANRRREIVGAGVLKTWILDLRSGRQLGLPSTGHAARGTSSPPSPSATNLYMEAGAQSREALIGEIDQGLYVTEMMGMGINIVTGDYSRGAAGYWIEKGELTHPVSELTVAGNLKDMFLNLTPADDLVFRYGVNAPTLRVDGMTLAGS